MSDFGIRYNAMEQAQLLMMQRLLLEIAKLKGDDGSAWLDRFRNAVTSEISDTQDANDQRPSDITKMSRSIIEGVVAMTKHRLAQLSDEGSA